MAWWWCTGLSLLPSHHWLRAAGNGRHGDALLGAPCQCEVFLCLGNCVNEMADFPTNAVDFILTDPPYLVGFRDRQGREIAGDKTDEWLRPACGEMYRVLKKDALMV